jgi:hypothetical protein
VQLVTLLHTNVPGVQWIKHNSHVPHPLGHTPAVSTCRSAWQTARSPTRPVRSTLRIVNTVTPVDASPSSTTTIAPAVPEASPVRKHWSPEAHDTRPVRHHASSARQVAVRYRWPGPSVAKQKRAAVRTSSSNSCVTFASDSRCDAA